MSQPLSWFLLAGISILSGFLVGRTQPRPTPREIEAVTTKVSAAPAVVAPSASRNPIAAKPLADEHLRAVKFTAYDNGKLTESARYYLALTPSEEETVSGYLSGYAAALKKQEAEFEVKTNTEAESTFTVEPITEAIAEEYRQMLAKTETALGKFRAHILSQNWGYREAQPERIQYAIRDDGTVSKAQYLLRNGQPMPMGRTMCKATHLPAGELALINQMLASVGKPAISKE